eukprot:SAG25_NODE_87_length_16363_cov_40.489179_8_plen_75_part_00
MGDGSYKNISDGTASDIVRVTMQAGTDMYVLASPRDACGASPARSSLIPNELTALFSPRISHGADLAAVTVAQI